MHNYPVQQIDIGGLATVGTSASSACLPGSNPKTRRVKWFFAFRIQWECRPSFPIFWTFVSKSERESDLLFAHSHSEVLLPRLFHFH